jgi:hypothetical protein
MVTRFLLQDTTDMSIRGVSGKESSACERGAEGAPPWLGGILHFGKPPVPHWSTPNVLAPPPPLRRSVKGHNTCAQFGKKRR